jgi:hypothetical protein
MTRLRLAALAALVTSGCAGPAPPPPATWDGADRTAAAAMAKLRERGEAFRTARAALELTWRGEGDDGDSESCRGSLSWVPPDSLRLRGTTAAFFTVFDLVADARNVRLDIPREGVVVFGRRDDPAWSDLPLSARELLVALRADPCDSDSCRDATRWETASPPVLRGRDWRLHLDPATGLPVAWRRDGSDREVLWSEWSVRDGVAWPLRIEIVDRARGEVCEVRMGRVDLDRSIPPSRFSLQIEEGREILTPQEAKNRLDRHGGSAFRP